MTLVRLLFFKEDVFMEKTVETGAFSREKIGEFIKDYGAIIGIVIILLVFQIFDHRFLRPANI